MKTPDGFQQAYNAQAAVDASSQVIVAQVLTNEANDQHQLKPLLKEIKENNTRQAEEISADAGYCSEENLKELNRRHITGYVATGRQAHGTSSPTQSEKEQGPLRNKMRQRLKKGGWRSRYRLRKQVVEPVFGQIKQARGFRQFLLRGVEKVKMEWSLICSAHNVLKLFTAQIREAGP